MSTAGLPNNAALLQALATGDNEAFSLIYHRYVPELLRFTRRTVFRPEDAEEIVQDVFESLWVRRTRLGHVVSLRSYLYSAVRYKLIRYINHSQVRKRYEEHYRLFESLFDALPEDGRVQEGLLGRLLAALEDLPSRCSEAMNLRLTQNLSNSEIATRMGISKETVENYMVKALAHLKTLGQQVLKGN